MSNSKQEFLCLQTFSAKFVWILNSKVILFTFISHKKKNMTLRSVFNFLLHMFHTAGQPILEGNSNIKSKAYLHQIMSLTNINMWLGENPENTMFTYKEKCSLKRKGGLNKRKKVQDLSYFSL